MTISANKFIPFFTFDGRAEEAMKLYTTLFEQSQILNITRYGAEGPGTEGSVMHATFAMNGQTFMCIDSNVKHDWTFTPAISIYVNCESEEEISRAFEKLSQGGKVLMPLASYPFAKQFGWVEDPFGVSWQLSLPLS